MIRCISEALRFSILAFLLGTLPLCGCQRKPSLEDQILADALRGDVVKITEVDAQQLRRVVEQHVGNVVIVAFWSVDSDRSLQQFSHVMAMSNVYKNDGLTLLTVAMDSPNSESMRDFLKASGATVSSGVNTMASQYGGVEVAYREFNIPDQDLPHFQLFDRTGRLAKALSSARDVDAELLALLSWETPSSSTPSPN